MSEEGKHGLPGQAHPGAIPNLASLQPLVNECCRSTQQRKALRCGIQLTEPALESGRIGDAIGVFDSGRCIFPGKVIHKATLQRLAAGQQAVMRIGWREERQEGECRVAGSADPAADLDPVMVLIMSLLTSPAMAHNRISQTKWTVTDDYFGSGHRPVGPVRSRLANRGRRWDKDNRTLWRPSAERSPLQGSKYSRGLPLLIK